VCVPEGSTLKGINDEIGIRSFTELFFYQALYILNATSTLGKADSIFCLLF
jgi:hypothetical protein